MTTSRGGTSTATGPSRSRPDGRPSVARIGRTHADDVEATPGSVRSRSRASWNASFNTPRPGSPRDLLNRQYVVVIAAMAIGVAGWLPVNNFLSLFVRDELGGDMLGAAVLLIAIQGGTATLGLASGLWMHRVGSRWSYALGLAGMTAFLVVMTSSSGAGAVLVAAPFLGVALALHWAGSQTYVLEVAPPARRGLATGIMSFATIAPPGIAGVAFGQIAEGAGFRVMTGVAGGMIAAAFLLVAIFLPSTTPRQRGPSRSAGDVINALREIPALAMVAARAGTTVSFGVVVLLTGPKLIAAGGDLGSVGLFTLVSAIAGAVSQIGIGRLSDAIGRRAIFALSLVVGGAAAVGFALADDVVAILTLSGVIYLAFGTHQTVLPAIAGDISRPGQVGTMMTLQTSAFALGMMFGAGATAALATTAPDAAFYVGAVGMAVALAALPWLRPAPTGASPPS